MKETFSARRLLLPLVPLYQLALALRELRLLMGLEPVRRLRFPVVSVGNLSTGGSGKTPLTIALAKALAERGLRVDVLSRGYGRQSQLAARVKPDGIAADFGDEPLLIARETGLPVFVASQRYKAGQLAEAQQSSASEGSGLVGQSFGPETKLAESTNNPEKAGEDQSVSGHDFSRAKNAAKSAGALAPERYIHLLDDGFQHRQLAREVNILLLNRHDWHDWLLPAGNLREPRSAVRRASVIAIPAGEPELEAELRAWGWQGPLWRLHRIMEIPAVSGPVTAFCGIARPEQFFAGLEAAGATLAARFAFPDHFVFTRAVLEELLAEAREKGATAIVTTKKDLVRVGSLASIFPKSLPLTTAQLRIEIEDQDTAIDWLMDRVAPAPPQPSL
jgi:tetraacyldisaccharide 4'-kinase